jgi:L-lactate dehydrogenase complex protein LldE
MLLGGDLGCLMNVAGKLAREGKGVAVRHVAEVLAGAFDQPPIGVARETVTPSATQEAGR